MTQHLITTTMQPGRVVSVDDEGLVDLTRMGVVATLVPSGLQEVPASVEIPSVAVAMQAGASALSQEVESSGSSEEGGQAAGAEQ
jgi:hypothetical protein